MLAVIRKFLESRLARPFFVVLIVPFVLFGVANVAQNWNSSSQLATVGDRAIEPTQFQQAYRQQLARVSRMLGGKIDPTPEIRRTVAAQTLQQLITQAAIENEVRRLGIVAPDDAVRQVVFEMPDFKNLAGAFDRNRFESLLRQNGYTEARFLDIVRSELAQRQLVEAAHAATITPETLLKPIYAFQREQRTADVVELPFLAAPEPAPPSEADLHRVYDNDPQRYAAPAYRRIKAVILSPDTLARTIDVPGADLQAYFDQHPTEFAGPEQRTIEVLVTQDEPTAQRLASQWIAGADWPAMQRAAQAVGAASTILEDTAQADIPTTELAAPVFQAPPETVSGPVQSPFGWQVFRVTKVTPPHALSFEAAKDQIRERVAHDRALDQVYIYANRLEDALSATGNLDTLPTDLGLAAITGSLDEKGIAPSGEPAYIPGTPALRQSIITSAFATPKNDQPRLVQGPDQSYYALVVEDETPPLAKPFDAVTNLVRDNYLHDARRRTQDQVAARLLAAIKAGGSLEDAATIASVRVQRTPPINRSTPTEGVPPELIRPIFALKPDDGTMLELPDGFVIVKLVSVASPDPASDPAAATQIRTELTQSITQDVDTLFAIALRDRDKPTVNQSMLGTLSQ